MALIPVVRSSSMLRVSTKRDESSFSILCCISSVFPVLKACDWANANVFASSAAAIVPMVAYLVFNFPILFKRLYKNKTFSNFGAKFNIIYGDNFCYGQRP